MPRENAIGKWNMRVSPDVFYLEKDDPFNMKDNKEELIKANIIRSIIDYQKIKDKEDAIDIGCGEGLYTKQVYNILGCDISPTAIKRAGEGFFVYDITKSSLKKKYKIVILSEVLYYIQPDMWGLVAENIYNCMDSDADFIISVGQYFNEEDIIGIFSEINFDIIIKLVMPHIKEKYGYYLIMKGKFKNYI